MKTFLYDLRYLVVLCVAFGLVLSTSSIFSQEYIMSDGGSVVACTGKFYDPGGTGNYPPPPKGFIVGIGGQSTYTYTICNPMPDSPITVTFTSFSLWSNNSSGTFCFVESLDKLHIYDGNSVSGSFKGTFQKTQSPGTVVGTSGCLTFKLELDNVGNNSPCAESMGGSGWEATISSPPVTAGPIVGPDTIFVAQTETFTTSGSPGGTWSSSDTDKAFINASGVVTGLNAGSSTIFYTLTECGGDIALKKIQVVEEPKDEPNPPGEEIEDTTKTPPPPETKVSIIDLDELTGITLFPNPTNHEVNIEFELSNSTQVQFSLIDMSGRVLTQQAIQASIGTNRTSIDMSAYMSGIYSVVVHSNGSTVVKKLVKN